MGRPRGADGAREVMSIDPAGSALVVVFQVGPRCTMAHSLAGVYEAAARIETADADPYEADDHTYDAALVAAYAAGKGAL